MSNAHIVYDAMGLPPNARTDKELVENGQRWAKRFADSCHFDVNESAVLALQLEHLFSQPINKRYSQLLSKKLIPAAPGGIPRGATQVARYGMDEQGAASIVHGQATQIPMVDTHARKMTTPIVGLVAGFSVSHDDIAAAAMSGMQIPTFGIDAAARAVAYLEDQILAVGNAAAALQGLLAVTGATTANMVTGAWTTSTADLICADVAQVIADIRIATNYTFRPDTLLLPSAPYAFIEQLPRWAVGGPTVLQWIEQSFRLKVFEWQWCEAANSVAGTDTAVFFSSENECVEGYWPVSPELLAPEYRLLGYTTAAYSRCGGVNSPNPTSIRYAANV
jgi:hypothetical protein